MFIQTEPMPEAAAMKFIPGRAVTGSETAEFGDRDATGRSPLAARLFAIEEVTAVTLGPDYIAVTKAGETDWQALKPRVLGAIMEHFMANEPVLNDPAAEAGDGADDDDDDDAFVAEIKELLDTRIAPAISGDGGGVVYHSFVDGTLYLEFSGGAMALIGGIENMLRHYLPAITAVRSHTDAVPKPGLDTPEGEAVQRVLDEQINPMVASHGGHIALVDVQGDTAYIRLEGGCQGCGMADVTLKQGVEVEIMSAVPTIRQVLDTTDHNDGDNPYYQPGKGGFNPN